MKIYVKTKKNIKGIPQLLRKQIKFEGSLNSKIKDLINRQTPYFEIVNENNKTKTIYSKAVWQQNYVKKEVKI